MTPSRLRSPQYCCDHMPTPRAEFFEQMGCLVERDDVGQQFFPDPRPVDVEQGERLRREPAAVPAVRQPALHAGQQRAFRLRGRLINLGLIHGPPYALSRPRTEGRLTVDDRIVNVCVNAGYNMCINVFLQSNTPPVAPIPRAAFAATVEEAMRQNMRAFRWFADQMTNVMVMQTMMIGPLLDAKHQLESQQIFAEWQAETHRDYQPSEQVCALGTLSRTMINAEDRVRRNILSIDSIMLKRELLNGYSASSWGPFADLSARMARYRTEYCDENDNKRELGTMCTSGASTRKNNDLNYYRTVARKLTLPVDFTNAALTPEEEDILTLSKNLFDHNVLTPIPERVMMPVGTNFDPLQDARMLSAVRGVARYSFANQVALKTPGTGLEAPRLQNIMADLGVAPADIPGLIGAQPSYYAQMNILSKKLFQNPQFFTNLYVGPANVARTGVALQALQIMHDRERYEASLRKEMLLSMILEMNLRRAQSEVINRVPRATR